MGSEFSHDSTALVDGFNLLMNMRYVPPFICRVNFLAPDFRRAYDLSVVPSDGSYRLIELDSATEWSFSRSTGATIQESRPVDARVDPERSGPNALMLAFPSRLPIWGRPNQFRIVNADRDGNEVILALRHHDPHVLASLTVNLDLGIPTRFDSPGQSVQYIDVQSA